MTRPGKSLSLLGGAAILLSASAYAASDKTHWGYKGKEGPENWAGLSKDFKACNGSKQSPIDLKAAKPADNEDITLKWNAFTPEVLNNGHTIQANAPKGHSTNFGGKSYEFLQVHFHHMSEHTIKGRHSPLEAHFVHKGGNGSLLVLGVMIEQGKASPEIAALWEAAPEKPGKTKAKKSVALTGMVPVASDYYRYSGSLTTPPCSEIVTWVVFEKPITASKAQIEKFASLYPVNNRPVQTLNNRAVQLGK